MVHGVTIGVIPCVLCMPLCAVSDTARHAQNAFDQLKSHWS